MKEKSVRRAKEIMNETLRVKANSFTLSAILENIKGLKWQEEIGESVSNYDSRLSHELRGYVAPTENWHISVEAKKLWERITDDDIRHYSYQERVMTKNDFDVLTYAGSHKRSLYNKHCVTGEVIEFNDIFIVEHITPAGDLKEAILAVYSETASDEENKEAFRKILDKMHVARILRKEDTEIAKASHRVKTSDVLSLSSEELCAKSMENMNYPTLA